MQTILFHRKFRRFHGGHLKVWDYFNHVLASQGFDARILFDANSSWDASNPWTAARERVIDSLDGVAPDALFVAGRDWQRFEALGLLDAGLPVLNLIQHVRHADEWSIQARYLGRKAVRLCVSDEVATAVAAAGSNGPIVVIPNSVEVGAAPLEPPGARPVDLLIAGLKQPVLAAELHDRLTATGRTVEVLTEHLPRTAFLEALRRARVTLFLPNREEGFYLPALEGMALGTIVVCPDCIGNRSFCLPGVNAFRPAYEADPIVRSTEAALDLAPDEAERLRVGRRDTVLKHSPWEERAAFHRVLENLEQRSGRRMTLERRWRATAPTGPRTRAPQ